MYDGHGKFIVGLVVEGLGQLKIRKLAMDIPTMNSFEVHDLMAPMLECAHFYIRRPQKKSVDIGQHENNIEDTDLEIPFTFLAITAKPLPRILFRLRVQFFLEFQEHFLVWNCTTCA